jgi:hypothetical protein
MEPVAWLCRASRDLPKEVKRQIAYYGQHPTAQWIQELAFNYDSVPYEPLSKYLYVQCHYPVKFVAKITEGGLSRCALWGRRYYKKFWICRSIYDPQYSELPGWVLEEVRSPDQ